MMINVRTRRCIVCGSTSIVELDSKKVQRWEDGEHVQDVWPNMSPGEREMLITGTHPDCWDTLFGGEEE